MQNDQVIETIGDDEVGLYADFDNRARRAAVAEGVRSSRILPIIDFAAYTMGGSLDDRRQVGRALRAACMDTGFFYLGNHGITQAELDIAHAWGLMLFELPRAEKMKLEKRVHFAQQGWMPVGGMAPDANPDKDADQKETFVLPRDRLPGEPAGDNPNVENGNWPDEQSMPGFQSFIRQHMSKRVAVAQRLCRALALSLDLDEDYLDEPHRFPNCALTYNYYPALDPAAVGRTQWGISPHTDYGSFTLLSQDALGGLEVRTMSDEWIDVPPIAGAFVVNLGDLFARWTNGTYRSSLHRASNFNAANRARVSLPLFFQPHPQALITCLPTCREPGIPAKYEPVEAGAYVRALLEQSFRTGRPGVAQRTVEERFKSL
jgi:isopenicillin N synthase-like dioxygenase